MNTTLESPSTTTLPDLETFVKMICLSEPDFVEKNAVWQRHMDPREEITITFVADESLKPGSIRVVDEVHHGFHRFLHSRRVHKLANMLFPNVIKPNRFSEPTGKEKTCVYQERFVVKPPTAHEQMELLVQLQEWFEQCGIEDEDLILA